MTCTSDFDYLTRNFQRNQSEDLITSGTIDSVLLDFVLSIQIVQNRAHTYVFVCGVVYDQQLVNASGPIGYEVVKTKTFYHLMEEPPMYLVSSCLVISCKQPHSGS